MIKLTISSNAEIKLNYKIILISMYSIWCIINLKNREIFKVKNSTSLPILKSWILIKKKYNKYNFYIG